MKEIKFRAWDKENKEMVEVELLGKRVLLCKNGEWENIEDFEVMQFTGLCDKNNREIYEGDVLKNDYGELWVVVWEGTGFMLSFNGDSKNIYSVNEYYFSSCEVIGNIYENPELSEGDNDE